jgi:predicted TIM-barrel fold metal-dependent hydrolase
MNMTALFDVNCLVGPGPLAGACRDAGGLLGAMDALEIDDALVAGAPAVACDAAEGNARLLDEIHGRSRLHACWVVKPGDYARGNRSGARQLRERGVEAARVFPRRCGPLRAWNSGGLFKALAGLAMPVLIDFELGHYTEHRQAIDWDGLHWVLGAFPELPIVLLRVGATVDSALFPLMERHPNLLVETSYYIGTGGLEHLSAQFGVERLLFGTGMPQYAPGPAITLLTYSGLSAAEKTAVGAANLRRLLTRTRTAR